jgi:DNA-binding NtrC family response regulator
MSVRKKRVIIVDDNKALSRFTGDLLFKRGFEVTCLHTIEKTESFLKKASDDIHAFLIDYRIGNKNSKTLVKSIRDQYPKCKIIMISGCVSKELTEIKTLFREGVIDMFIEKPVSFTKIEKYLNMTVS